MMIKNQLQQFFVVNEILILKKNCFQKFYRNVLFRKIFENYFHIFFWYKNIFTKKYTI